MTSVPLSAKAVRALLAHMRRLQAKQARVDQARVTWPWCWRCRCLLVRCACPVVDMELWG
jgi:hypothetical protein